MNVLLISTYELGHQPLGLASPLAHLRAAGIEAGGLDLAVEPFDEAAVAGADFIGISTPMHTALRLGVRAARRIRAQNPGAHICFYGLYAGLNGEYLLRRDADSVISGEFEQPLLDAVCRLQRDEAATPAQTNLGRQHFLPPDRIGLPSLDRYARLDHKGTLRLAGSVEASRGCAHRCLHCPITPVYGGRLRIVPAETVLADVDQLVSMGAEHITFADPDFFNGIRHSLTVAREMHRRYPKVTFDATIKIEHLLEHREALPELRELGCLFITSAVESLSEKVLRNLEKGHSRADVREALELTRAAGISLRPTLLPFTPWTRMADYLDLLDFIERNGLIYHLEPVQLAIRLLVPPGSSLLASPSMRPHLGRLDEDAFAYRWRHPDPRMDALADRVASLVQEAAGRKQDAAETFGAIRSLAFESAGLPERRDPIAVSARPPGLTEAWFC
jgi:radical SAM superfamily enzyme YgiQ (UPF0313 family)